MSWQTDKTSTLSSVEGAVEFIQTFSYSHRCFDGAQHALFVFYKNYT